MPDCARELLITGKGGLLTVITSVADPVPALFVAEISTLDVPAAAGFPEIAPVVVSTLSPVGSPVALKDVGLLEAVI